MVTFTPERIARWKRITAAGGGGYTAQSKVTLLDADGNTLSRPVPVIDLSWGEDGTSTKMVTGSLVVPAVDWSHPDDVVDWRPVSMVAPLTPFGNRVKVETTVDNGLEAETILIGVGLISEVKYDRPAEILRIGVSDLADEIDQAQTTVDFTVSAQQPATLVEGVDVVITSAWLRRDPVLTGATDGVLPQKTWNPGTSLWELIQDMAAAVDPKRRVVFTRDGGLLVRDVDLSTALQPGAVLSAAPEFSLRTGDGGHLTELETTLSRADAVNVVAVAVEDTEVQDPTYADPAKPDEQADAKPESDEAGKRRKKIIGIGGTASGMAKVTRPSGRKNAFNDRAPTRPRWPFAAGVGGVSTPFRQTSPKCRPWCSGWHTGEDFTPGSGTQIVSVCQGRVIFSGPYYSEGPYGRVVIVRASDGDWFMYCHLLSMDVKKGDFVMRGDKIGKVGGSKIVSGRIVDNGFAPHLHLERRRGPGHNYASDSVHWRDGDVK